VNQLNIRTLEDAGRATAVWSTDVYDSPSRFGDVIVALVPASLILAAATALMLALL
jgi:hypothetical protein